MQWVILASCVGALLGCFTGLVPGIHANTIAILLFSLTIAIEDMLGLISDKIDVSILIVVAIASTSITHTFLNFIPGTVLGAPEENNALGVLPMHEMILRKETYECGKCKDFIYHPKNYRNRKPDAGFPCPNCGDTELGKDENIIEGAPGYLAIYYSAYGSLYAAIFFVLLVVPLKLLIGRESLAEERGYDIAKEYMLYILLAISLILILTDRKSLKKFNYNSKGKTFSFYGFKESQVDWRLDDKEKKLLGDINLGWKGRAFGLVAVIGVFLLSGAFGWVVLNQVEGTADSPLNPFLRENYGFYLPSTTLFPAFTGLFGIATLLFSITTTPRYGLQNLGNRYIATEFWDLKKKGEKGKASPILGLEIKKYISAFFIFVFSGSLIFLTLFGIKNPLRIGEFTIDSWLLGFIGITLMSTILFNKYIGGVFGVEKVPKYQCGKCDLYYGQIKCKKCEHFFNSTYDTKLKRIRTIGDIVECNKCYSEFKIEEIDDTRPKCKCNEQLDSLNYSNSAIGALSGSISGLLPGVTAGIGTIIAIFFKNLVNSIIKMIINPDKKKIRDYSEDNDFSGRSEDVIMTLAAVNTAASLTILAGLFIILRPRNGTTIVIDQMITVNEWIKVDEMPIVLTCLLISVLISIIIGFLFTSSAGIGAVNIIRKLKKRDEIIQKNNPKYKGFAPKAMKIMIGLLFLLAWLFTGLIGVLVMLVGTAIGMLPPLLGLRKSHCMGFLLVPVMIFYYNMSGSGLFT